MTSLQLVALTKAGGCEAALFSSFGAFVPLTHSTSKTPKCNSHSFDHSGTVELSLTRQSDCTLSASFHNCGDKSRLKGFYMSIHGR
eukprot:5450772-Amphidinium_carterae.1